MSNGIKLYKPTGPVRTPGQNLIFNLMMMVISVFIYAVIAGIFKLLFWPVRYIFLTDDQIYDDEKKKAKRKIRAREGMLAAYRESDRNPIGDPRYEEWYKQWRAGQVLDSRLLWAPDFYIAIPPAGKKFNPQFLAYLEIQVNLHKEAGWANRFLLKKTLWQYYPELSSDLERVPADIQALRERVEAKKLTGSLMEEFQKLGMSDSAVQRLMSKNLSPEALAKKVTNIRAGAGRGFSEGASITIDELGIDMASDHAASVNQILEDTPLPAFVTIAYIKEEIDKQSLDYLIEKYREALDRNGMTMDTMKLMLMFLNEERKDAQPRLKRAHMDRTYGKPVWEAV